MSVLKFTSVHFHRHPLHYGYCIVYDNQLVESVVPFPLSSPSLSFAFIHGASCRCVLSRSDLAVLSRLCIVARLPCVFIACMHADYLRLHPLIKCAEVRLHAEVTPALPPTWRNPGA